VCVCCADLQQNSIFGCKILPQQLNFGTHIPQRLCEGISSMKQSLTILLIFIFEVGSMIVLLWDQFCLARS
jgi:hypothetical protein